MPSTAVDREDAIEVAKGLLSIAELAMPDTYYATDSRCQAARRLLLNLGVLPKKEHRFLKKTK